MLISIYSHTRESFAEALFARIGKGKLHAALLYSHWMQKGELPSFFEDLEPQAHALVREMIDVVDWSLPEVVEVLQDKSGSKILLRLADGLLCESVVILSQSRTTLCVSAQVGCMRGCAFCETGKMGLKRSLSVGEIVAQLFVARFVLGHKVRNLVFMGMGEPFDNYEAVMGAVKVFSDTGRLCLALSHMTVSTVGHVPGILRFAKEAPPTLNLAISLTSAIEEKRKKLMPITRKWGLEELKKAMERYLEEPRRKILVSYVLLAGANDGTEDADALIAYLQGMRVTINCIPYNAQTDDKFVTPSQESADRFIAYLRDAGFHVLLRHTRGSQIMAGCGQLGGREDRSL